MRVVQTEQEVKEAGGLCPVHKTPVVRRSEPCHFFALSKFQDRLLRVLRANPASISRESRNEVTAFVQAGLQDVNITATGTNGAFAFRSTGLHDLGMV